MSVVCACRSVPELNCTLSDCHDVCLQLLLGGESGEEEV